MTLLCIGHLYTLIYLYSRLYDHVLNRMPMTFSYVYLKYVGTSVNIFTNIAYFRGHDKVRKI